MSLIWRRSGRAWKDWQKLFKIILFVLKSLYLGSYKRKEKGFKTWGCLNLTPNIEFVDFIFNSKNANEVQKTWNLAWYPHMTPRGRGKDFKTFCKSYDVQCLETRPSLKKNLCFERERAMFESETTAASSTSLELIIFIELSTFSTSTLT